MSGTFRIIFVGDIVGAPGRALFKKYAQSLRRQYHADALVVNGENSAFDGRGIMPKQVGFLRAHGADMVTSGNHIFAKREIPPYFSSHKDLLRPANFPPACPGSGVGTFTAGGVIVGVLNIQGRIFMREHLDCPFRAAETALTYLKSLTNLILVDFHGEASSEKYSMGYFLDGRVSACLGTHTHVPTADEQILPKGTAFISDVGMCGSASASIGMKREAVLGMLLTQMPHKFEVATEPPYILCAVVIEIDRATGKALSIERIKIVDHELDLQDKELG